MCGIRPFHCGVGSCSVPALNNFAIACGEDDCLTHNHNANPLTLRQTSYPSCKSPRRTLSIMGLVETAVGPVVNAINNSSLTLLILSTFVSFVTVAVVVNVLSQLLFKNPHEPPIVFHWFPLIGSTITYGIDPYKFFFKCREKVGAPATKHNA